MMFHLLPAEILQCIIDDNILDIQSMMMFNQTCQFVYEFMRPLMDKMNYVRNYIQRAVEVGYAKRVDQLLRYHYALVIQQSDPFFWDEIRKKKEYGRYSDSQLHLYPSFLYTAYKYNNSRIALQIFDFLIECCNTEKPICNLWIDDTQRNILLKAIIQSNTGNANITQSFLNRLDVLRSSHSHAHYTNNNHFESYTATVDSPFYFSLRHNKLDIARLLYELCHIQPIGFEVPDTYPMQSLISDLITNQHIGPIEYLAVVLQNYELTEQSDGQSVSYVFRTGIERGLFKLNTFYSNTEGFVQDLIKIYMNMGGMLDDLLKCGRVGWPTSSKKAVMKIIDKKLN